MLPSHLRDLNHMVPFHGEAYDLAVQSYFWLKYCRCYYYLLSRVKFNISDKPLMTMKIQIFKKIYLMTNSNVWQMKAVTGDIYFYNMYFREIELCVSSIYIIISILYTWIDISNSMRYRIIWVYITYALKVKLSWYIILYTEFELCKLDVILSIPWKEFCNF